jgi:PAS domain S-box-containing protein
MDQEKGSLEICMAQKANMEAIFHSVADGILTLDTRLRVLNLNQAGQDMLGLTEEAAAGRSAAELLRGQLWDPVPLVEATLATGEGTRERENLLVRPDGQELRSLVTVSRLYDTDGRVGGAVVVIRDITRVRELEVRLENRTRLHAIIGRSHLMQEIFTLIEEVAPSDSTVLIQGESGTGKELVADAIHRSSRRQAGPFVKVNCSALSEGLLESELFGHVKGAYTGALHDRKGRFELADGGTLLLDEVGDLPERIQVKLLRILQEREVERVGDSRTRKIDVRILAATHQPLRALVEQRSFRQDLFYRLNVIPIVVPPLRDRREDVPELAAEFLRGFAESMGKTIDGLTPDALRVLMDHRWPGNVRELRNAIEHAVVKCQGAALGLGDLPRELIEEAARVERLASPAAATPLPGGELPAGTLPVGAPPAGGAPATSPERQRAEIEQALAQAGGRKSEAARLLGIDRSTLWRRMRKLGLA